MKRILSFFIFNIWEPGVSGDELTAEIQLNKSIEHLNVI